LLGLKSLTFTNDDDEYKWTAYILIRNLYDIYAIHVERLSR